jgi:membrane-anchored mycosin MYCP
MAAAISPPTVPVNPPIPADPPAAADPPLKRDDNKPCNLPGVLPTPSVTDIPQANALISLDQAHKISTGAGVTVAVIDTGVAGSARVPAEGLADFVDPAANGLQDCDMHGTLVAGLIGARPAPGDQFIGVAPDARLVSIRQTSEMWSLANPAGGTNPQAQHEAGQINALAAAIVKAANAGAHVINMSVLACVPAAHPIDQNNLAIAVWYASVVKDVVLVAAAGNIGSGNADCQANPDTDPLTPADPRNWDHVVSVSVPSWFSDYVLSVGAVDAEGAGPDKTNVAKFSMPGPWVSLAAPGVNIISTGPDGTPVNALPARDGLTNIFGTSFSAAYASGTAALIRSKFPGLTSAQVRCRLIETAHSGPRGVDNMTGYGLIDPVAALTYDLPASCPRVLAETHREKLTIAPKPVPPDHRPHNWALIISTTVLATILIPSGVLRRRVRRSR